MGDARGKGLVQVLLRALTLVASGPTGKVAVSLAPHPPDNR